MQMPTGYTSSQCIVAYLERTRPIGIANLTTQSHNRWQPIAGHGSYHTDSFTATRTGPVSSPLLGESSDYAQPITGHVTEVTCPVIGQARPELTPSKRQKTGPGLCISLFLPTTIADNKRQDSMTLEYDLRWSDLSKVFPPVLYHDI